MNQESFAKAILASNNYENDIFHILVNDEYKLAYFTDKMLYLNKLFNCNNLDMCKLSIKQDITEPFEINGTVLINGNIRVYADIKCTRIIYNRSKPSDLYKIHADFYSLVSLNPKPLIGHVFPEIQKLSVWFTSQDLKNYNLELFKESFPHIIYFDGFQTFTNIIPNSLITNYAFEIDNEIDDEFNDFIHFAVINIEHPDFDLLDLDDTKYKLLGSFIDDNGIDGIEIINDNENNLVIKNLDPLNIKFAPGLPKNANKF